MDDKDYWTVRAMTKFGGSFVQRLGDLALHADHNNLKLIKETWSEYWNSYEKMGLDLQQKVESERT